MLSLKFKRKHLLVPLVEVKPTRYPAKEISEKGNAAELKMAK